MVSGDIYVPFDDWSREVFGRQQSAKEGISFGVGCDPGKNQILIRAPLLPARVEHDVVLFLSSTCAFHVQPSRVGGCVDRNHGFAPVAIHC